MVKEKISRMSEEKRIFYSEKQWKIFWEKRRKAGTIIEALQENGLEAYVHGSIARGDVHSKSDVDIIILNQSPSYKIEVSLYRHDLHIYSKMIVQATPTHTPKVYYILDPSEELIVSFPIAKLMPREQEFYKFSGMIGYKELLDGKRVPGVNKRLELIIPIDKGHIVKPVIGNESIAARLLDISVETVMERVRVLTRRDEVGRTGVYIKTVLRPEDSVESAVRELMKKNPYIKKILEERG